MKGDVLLHHDYIVRLTWSLPPHSPAGGFAPKPVAPHYYLSRHYFFSAGLTSKPHHAHNDFAFAYVDRFACDWPRLSTTDPYTVIIR